MHSIDGRVIIVLIISFDEVNNVEHAKVVNISKYKDLVQFLPFIIASLGDQHITNDNIRSTLNIHNKCWKKLMIETIKSIIERNCKKSYLRDGVIPLLFFLSKYI